MSILKLHYNHEDDTMHPVITVDTQWAERLHRWREIVERASIGHERLHPTFQPCRLDPCTAEAGEARIERWRQTAALGDHGNFERLLAFDHLDLNSALRIVSPVMLTAGAPLPRWAELMDRGIAVQGGSPEDDLCANPSAAADTFASWHDEVWRPLLAVAAADVRRRSGQAYGLLTPAAMGDLKSALGHSLSELSRRTLDFERAVWQACTQTTMASLITGAQSGHPRSPDDYIASLRGEGLFDLCLAYPVLARLVGTVVALWIDASVEMLARLSEDLAPIGAMSRTHQPLGRVVRVLPSLSDRHHGGRSVMLLQFETGPKVIYKPKDLGIEAAYTCLVDWLNHSGIPSPLRGPRVLERPGYGWVEYVEERRCPDEDHVTRYHYCCGETLCLAHVLGAIDLHADNIVADQEHPVIIDLETVLHARVSHAPEATLKTNSEGSYGVESVMRTGLLPYAITPVSNDLSGIGGHRVALDSSSADLRRHHKVILDGFDDMYHFMAGLQNRFFTSECPFSGLLEQTTRFIFRPTEAYATLLNHLTSPSVLRDGADFSVEMSVLSRIGSAYDSVPPFWPLLGEEVEALKRFDIPHFSHAADSSRLPLESGVELDGFFSETAASGACRRISMLSEMDRRAQSRTIAGALFSDAAYQPQGNNNQVLAPGHERLVPLSTDELLGEAVRIGESIADHAVEIRGETTWITPEVTENDKFRCLTTLDAGVFTGRCGIALFLGLLGRLSGRRDFVELAWKAVQPVRAWKFGPDEAGARGCGSVVYAFSRLAAVLDAPELIHEARKFTARWNHLGNRFPSCDDVVEGTAGDLLGILSLCKCNQFPDVHTAAASLAWQLVRGKPYVESNLTSTISSGFAHGAAGIGYALGRFSNVTGDRSARRTSQALLKNVSVNDPALLSDPLEMSWCNGRVGVALAHLASLPLFQALDIRDESQRFLHAAAQMELGPIDSLCCGNMGRVELFITAGQTLREETFLHRGQLEASRIVARARARGRYAIGKHSFFVPDLFKGMAGVGYMLLRAAYPERVCSVALWE